MPEHIQLETKLCTLKIKLTAMKTILLTPKIYMLQALVMILQRDPPTYEMSSLCWTWY